jgi:ABC-2 type transport system ATP-binding protein/nitrous oxidase accessory protein
MIAAENLTKQYGSVLALDHVSFVVSTGESIALWGSNGAGKTTTLRCLLGAHAFEGRLLVNGIDVSREGKRARASIGYVPQESVFYDMSVLETVRFYARLKKVGGERARQVLEEVQIAEHEHKRVRMLSGGMKQRLALAIALLADPPILILDEPTANLDVQAQRDFIHTIQSLNQAGKTVVFSSHRLDEVMSIAQRVLVLNAGRMALECAPQELSEKLGLQRWLRIWVPKTSQEDTLRVLAASGYAFAPNGHSVYVQVREGSKMSPLRVLESAQIPVEDFELIEHDVITPAEASR